MGEAYKKPNYEIAKTLRNSSSGNAAKNIVLKYSQRTGSGHEECYKTFKKLVRNTEYSKSDNFKILSTLAYILKFLMKK